MKEAKHAIVVNQAGDTVEFVITESIMVDEKETYTILFYTLQDGERLVFEGVEEALSMLKPHWNGNSWEESAAEAEITAAQPESVMPQPTETELLAAELSLAIAKMQTNMDIAIAELSMAIAAQ